MSQIRDKVNAGKLYCPPLKRHEVRTNNPFYNGAFLGGTGMKSMSTAAGEPSTQTNEQDLLSPSIDRGIFGSHNPPSQFTD